MKSISNCKRVFSRAIQKSIFIFPGSSNTQVHYKPLKLNLTLWLFPLEENPKSKIFLKLPYTFLSPTHAQRRNCCFSFLTLNIKVSFYWWLLATGDSLVCWTSICIRNENLQENRLMVEKFSVPGKHKDKGLREAQVSVAVMAKVLSILTCWMSW